MVTPTFNSPTSHLLPAATEVLLRAHTDNTPNTFVVRPVPTGLEMWVTLEDEPDQLEEDLELWWVTCLCGTVVKVGWRQELEVHDEWERTTFVCSCGTHVVPAGEMPPEWDVD